MTMTHACARTVLVLTDERPTRVHAELLRASLPTEPLTGPETDPQKLGDELAHGHATLSWTAPR